MSILGGLCSVTISYLIPSKNNILFNLFLLAYCYVKVSGKPVKSAYNLTAIIFFGLLIFIGYFSVLVTLYEMVKGVGYIGEDKDLLDTC